MLLLVIGLCIVVIKELWKSANVVLSVHRRTTGTKFLFYFILLTYIGNQGTQSARMSAWRFSQVSTTSSVTRGQHTTDGHVADHLNDRNVSSQ